MRTLALGLSALLAASGCSLVNDPDEIGPGVDTTVPPTPEGLVATPGQTWVSLRWDAVEVADLDGYAVFVGTIAGDLASAGQTTDPSFVVTGLADGTPYHFSVVTFDEARNVSDFSAEVTATPDGAPPTVTFDPENGATDQNVNVDLVLTFSEPMDRTSVQAAVTVARADAGAVPSCAWSWDSGDQIAVCNFTADLETAKSYTAMVGAGARDRAGNAIVSASATFTTAAGPDVTPPTIVSSNPANGATGTFPETNISVTFGEAMDQSSITTSTFQIVSVSAGSVVDHRNGLFTWSNGGRTVAYDPPVSFQNGALVTYRIGAGVKDLAGNVMGGSDIDRTFRIAYQKTVAIESDPDMDGFIASDGSMGFGYTTMIVGDGADDRYYRSWVTFPHATLTPAPTRILSATFSVYRAVCSGFPFTALDTLRFPLGYRCIDSVFQDCDYDLMARHVDSGPSLDVADFAAGVLASGPELSEQYDGPGWLSRAVDGYVRSDVAAGRTMTQFRLEFPDATNGDGIWDACWFHASENAAARPRLVVTFEHP